jgi:hypothetical protein
MKGKGIVAFNIAHNGASVHARLQRGWYFTPIHI